MDLIRMDDRVVVAGPDTVAFLTRRGALTLLAGSDRRWADPITL